MRSSSSKQEKEKKEEEDALPLGSTEKKGLLQASRDGDGLARTRHALEQSHGSGTQCRRRLFTSSPLVSALREAKHMKSEREKQQKSACERDGSEGDDEHNGNSTC